MPSTTQYSVLRAASLTDAANTQTAFTNLTADLDFKVIPSFASRVARTAALTAVTVQAGAMCWIADIGMYDYYTGTAWVARYPYQRRKTADQTHTANNNVQQSDSHLIFNLEANKTYQMRGLLAVKSSAVAHFKVAWTNVPAGVGGSSCFTLADNTLAAAGSSTWTTSFLQVNTTGGATIDLLQLYGIMSVLSTPATNLTLTWSKATAEASTTTLFAGSYIEFIEIP